jgi:hypothetical protein
MGSTSAITHLRSPGRCCQSVREAFRLGRVSIADCYAMSHVSEPEQLALLAAKRDGLSAAEVTHRVRKAKNGSSTAKFRRLRCPMASGAVVQISFADGGGIENAIEVAQDWVRIAKRAVERGWDAKTLERTCADEAKAGKPS